MTSPALIGLAAGFVVGLVNFGVIRRLSRRVEMAETRKVLGVVAVVDLVFFPVAGALIGAYAWA